MELSGSTTIYHPTRACRFSVNACRHFHISTAEIRPSYIETSSLTTSLSSIDTPATFMSNLGTLASREKAMIQQQCAALGYIPPLRSTMNRTEKMLITRNGVILQLSTFGPLA